MKVCSVVVKLLLRADKTTMMKSQAHFNGLLQRRNLKLVNKGTQQQIRLIDKLKDCSNTTVFGTRDDLKPYVLRTSYYSFCQSDQSSTVLYEQNIFTLILKLLNYASCNPTLRYH